MSVGPALGLNSSLSDYGVSSMDQVAFAKLVAQEFNTTFAAEDCVNLKSVGELIQFLDARS